jgi:hypothetical protein
MIWHLAAEDGNRDVLEKLWEWAKTIKPGIQRQHVV